MGRRLAFAAFAAALLGSGQAGAYCRSAVCDGSADATHGKVCSPPEPDDCGLVLQWRQPCIGFSVQKDASNQIDYVTAASTLRKAFAAWTGVDCGGRAPGIQVFDLGSVACNKIEYNQRDGNANILMFRDQLWPHEDQGTGVTDTIALTTVTFDLEKGDIYDADIEVNTANNHFTTSDVVVDVDLLSVLTHEAGHFLGMAHSAAEDATMFPDYSNGDISLRTLSNDDRAGICDAYPPERRVKGECTGIPRHGFSPYCSAEQTEGKCSASAAPPEGVPRWVLLAGGLLVAAQTTRARARRKIS